MQVDHTGISRIRNALKFRPKGMSISEIAHQLRMNRNSVAKYLEILLIAGEVEVTPHGASRVYTLSQRVPASAMMRFSTDMTVLIGPEGHILQVNEPFLTFFSLSREEVSGKPISGIRDTDLRSLLEGAIPGEGESAGGEVTECTLRRGESMAFIRLKSLPTVFDDGTEGTTVVIEDQTARYLTECALAEREALYRSVIDNIQDAFYRSDDQGRLILASPSFARMLGYDSVEECLGKNIRETFYVNPAERDAFVHLLEEGGPVREYELLLKRKDGSPLYVLTTTHLYYGLDGQVSGTEGIFQDNTERRMYDRLLHQATVDLQALSRTAMEFLELPADADLFAAIAAGLESFIPGSSVFVSSYDPRSGQAKLEHTVGPGRGGLLPSNAGTEPEGLTGEVDIRMYPLIRSGHYHSIPLSVPELLIPRFTEEAWSAIQGVGNYASGGIIGFIRGDQLLGCATVLVPPGKEPVQELLVEAYARLASLALQKRAAEVVLREIEIKLSASEEKLQRSLDDIEFLSSRTRDFLALPPGDAIYQRIASDIHTIVPQAMVLVSSYDQESGFITAMCIQDDGKREICTRVLGGDPTRTRAPINTAALSSLRAGNLHKVSLPLYEVFLHAVPQESCERLRCEMPVGEVYAIGFTKGDELYGNAVIFLPGDAKGANLSLIEAYARGASIALQRAAAVVSLNESEALFSGIAEHSPIPITVIGDNGSCIYANPAFRDLFGYDLRDLPSLREWALIAFPDTCTREEAMREWEKITQGRDACASGSFTTRVRCHDDVQREIRFRIAPLAHGGCCVLYEDITLPMQAERYRQVLSFLVESTGDAVIGMNMGGFILSWNRAAEEIYGFSRQEAVGQHILLIIPPDRRYEYDEIMGTVLSGKVISGLRTRRVAKDGTFHDVEVTVSPIRDSDGAIIGASTIVRKDDGKKTGKLCGN